jgi:hypothetical protein
MREHDASTIAGCPAQPGAVTRMHAGGHARLQDPNKNYSTHNQQNNICFILVQMYASKKYYVF